LLIYENGYFKLNWGFRLPLDWLAWWGYTAWYAAQRVKWQKQGTMILASQKLALLVFKLPLGLAKISGCLFL